MRSVLVWRQPREERGRAILLADGLVVAASGALLSSAAGPLSRALDLANPGAFAATGLGFLAYGGALAWHVAHHAPSLRLVRAVATLNTAWVLGSVAALVLASAHLSDAAQWVIGLAALVVAGFAVAQWTVSTDA